MSLFKFHDSNSIKKSNYPDIEASVDTYNGYQFVVASGENVAIATDTAAKTADIFVMNNIINQPEIENTDDYHVSDGEKIRAIRLANHIEQKIDISQDLVYYRVVGTNQVETSTVVGTIDVGVLQVETATVVGTIGAAGAGNATVVVTAAGMTSSPKTVSVAVANDDTAAQVAGKIRTALIADADIGHVSTGFFTVTGADANIILTAKTKAANDSTLNVSIDNGTCTGLTAAPTSANTTAGVKGAGNASVIITGAGFGQLSIISVAVAEGDNAAAVAGKIRTALGENTDFGTLFTVSGATDKVIVTKKVKEANDATLNVAIGNGTCSGLTAAPTSANTTAGVAPITTNAAMWADLAVGNYLVPRVTADTDYPMKWKKVASVTGYKIYLVITNKNTFGSFTYEKGTGTVLGGLTCKIKLADLTE